MNTEVAQRIAEGVVAEGKVPGLSVAVAGPEGVLYGAAVGYADLAERWESTVDDQYPWFSMTKIATATAVVRLHVDGRLDLDTPIGTYLPGYRPSAKHGHPTTRQLLTHTAGLANPLPIRWVRPEGDREDPALLDRIVAKHGTPRRTFGRCRAGSSANESPATPLCAPSSSAGPAYGGLVGTVTDAALLAAARSAGRSDEHPLMPYNELEEMRTISAPGKPFDHGIGWFRKPAGRTPTYVEHYGTGCGFWNAMRIYPDRRLAMVAMTNTAFKWDFDNLFTQLEQLRWGSGH